MKKSALFLLLISGFTFLAADWQPMGPPGGNFRALASAPSNDNIIYIASYGSPCNIWKTTDAGNNWVRAGSVSDYVYSLAVDPTNANIVYAGGINYVFRSTNGGNAWTQQTLPTYHWYIYDLKVHPTVPTTLMAACYIYANNYYHMGFLKSTNSGTSWMSETLTVDTSYAYSVAIDPTNPNNVYVGGYRYGSGLYNATVFKSTNGGSTFSLTGTLPGTPYYVYSVAVHQTNPNYVYAGTLYGVYRSTDGGSSWVQTSTGNYNYSISTTPANTSLLYSGGYGVIYRSTDAGATWTSSATGLAGYYFYGLAASRTLANRVYATNNTDFYRSTDTGASWAYAHNGLNAAPISAMANAPSAPGTIYVDDEGASMYRTTNSGATWNPLTKPLTCGQLCDFGVDYDDPNTVLAFEGSG
jgi:photosystem II stability/assembly factor-like uncharacterized protein